MAITPVDTEVNLVINNVPDEQTLLAMEQGGLLQANQLYNTPDNSTPVVYNIENAYYRLPLGSIFSSSIPQTSDDVHLLDGSEINLTDRYLPFYVLLNSLAQQGYDVYYESDGTHTAAELRAEDITNTGNAGKFLLDSVNNTLQLPTITTFVQGLTDLTNLGLCVEAGLPNITGGIAPNVTVYSNKSAYGSFRTYEAGTLLNGAYTSGSTTGNYGYTFDASKSNSTYGNSNTVQPPSVKYPYYIVLAQSPLADMVTDVQPNPQGTTIANLTSLQINGVNYSIESGMSNPMTTANDIIIGGVDGVPTRLAKGSNGQVVGIDSNGNVAYINQSGGGGGTTVVANPTLIGTEELLTSIGIENVNYKIPQAAFHYFEEVE